MADETADRLRILLQRAALSPERFAHRLNRQAAQMGLPARIDRKTPYKWLRGGTPREPWAALAAAVLSEQLGEPVSPEDIGWRSARGVLYVSADAGLDMEWSAAGAIKVAIEVAEANVMDRRVFLNLTGAALTQPALEWLIAAPVVDIAGGDGRRVFDADVDAIEQMSAQLRRMDDRLGGGAVLDLARGQVRFVLDLLRNRRYTDEVGRRLHGAAGELLRLAGWLSFDSGQHAQAQRFWVAALHGAHAAGDRALGANILAFMSNQAKHLDQDLEAVRLAEAACHGYGSGSPRVRAILALRAAEAHAKMGATASCRSAIDDAYSALRDTAPERGEPAWAYWLDEAQVNAQAGYCYTRLGDWGRAQQHLTAALRLQQDCYAREGALRRALLATTFAAQGDPEQACAVAHRAVDIVVEDVDSERCVGHIHRVREALTPYRRTTVVRDFFARSDQLLGVPA